MSEGRTDEELVAAFLSGERTAFDVLFSRYQTKLFNLAFEILGHYHDAEDAVQETWLGVWQNIRLYPPTRKFSSWLYGIGRNKCYDELRRRYRKLEVPLPEDIDRIKSHKIRAAAFYKAAREWCLAVLNHRQRELYKFVVVAGKDYEEILTYEEEFCPAPKGTPLELLPEHFNQLRDEFAAVMEIVLERAKEWRRRYK